MTDRRLWIAGLMLVACAGRASAQGTYVSASLLGDIVRSTHTNNAGYDDGAGGEALGFALRVGTPLGAAWGVELEFARPAEIEDEGQPRVLPLALQRSGIAPVEAGQVAPVYPFVYPYQVRTSHRNTTLSAAVWAQQQLSARFAMVYLGGMGFYRSEHEYDLAYSPLVRAIPLILPFESETIVYGVRPMAGVESRIPMTEHAQLVPGIRLHGSDNGWLIRPSIGIAWTF
jgi:hypothetical protein